MSASVLYMSMSLDGFIAGPNETFENGLGDVGEVNAQVFEESVATGATVAGRGTFEPAGGWGGDHHDGVPIWVYSRHERTRVLQGEDGVTHMHYRVLR